MGSPLQCWIPQYYQKSWGKYAENYCWVKNTYYLKDDFPKDPKDRRGLEISYYQWIPIVLALQAFLFYFPIIVWRLANWQAGISVQKVVSAACTTGASIDPDDRKKAVDLITSHMLETAELSSNANSGFSYRLKRTFFCLCGNQKFGSFLISLYLIVKLLFCVNVMMQFYLLNAFLGTGNFYGFTLLLDLINGREWHESGYFPRVTFCDFRVRAMAQDKPHTIQCVLPINLFSEKIYIFLWFWFLLVAVLTLSNTLWWFFRTLTTSRPVTFLKNYLKLKDVNPSDRDVKKFIQEKLLSDGIFLLRLISTNAGTQISTLIVESLWKQR